MHEQGIECVRLRGEQCVVRVPIEVPDHVPSNGILADRTDQVEEFLRSD